MKRRMTPRQWWRYRRILTACRLDFGDHKISPPIERYIKKQARRIAMTPPEPGEAGN